MKYIVRLKSNQKRPEEYYFDSYLLAWEFMARCKEQDYEVDLIKVRNEPRYEKVVD